MKERIKTISGFKNTTIGCIPVDWEVKRIGKLTKTTTGGTPSTDKPEYWGGDIKWMNSGDLNLKRVYEVKGRITESGLKNSSTKIIPSNCVLIGLAGQGKTRGTVAMNMIPLCINQSIAAIFPSEKLHQDYLYYNLDLRYLELRKLSTGDGGRGGLNLSLINSLIIPLPEINEQLLIAKYLAIWDNAIEKTQNLIELKEKRKKSLMQKLLSGKKRIKGYKDKIGFSLLKNYLREVSIRNDSYKVNNVLSVTNTRGFINQSDQFEKSVASLDLSNYKIIKKGQFAYNPSRVNVGSIDLLSTFEIGILSPMYVVFETDNERLLPQYLYFHLLSYWFLGHIPMYVQGSVRDSLSFDGLCGMKFFIPSIEEQQAIVVILNCAEKEVKLLKQKLESLKQQKKGLMQVLLTGKIRVNNNGRIS